MKILLTGASGYIGKRLLPQLVGKGHRVVCLVRDKNRFSPPSSLSHAIDVYEGDLLESSSLEQLPKDIEAAYYLVHSMATDKNYSDKESLCAKNFAKALSACRTKHVVYLGGISNPSELSTHLKSRLHVEDLLRQGSYHFTAIRAGIIIGSGSASFEIIRDLVEKLPVMITPKWLNTKCQPIAIRDVLEVLLNTLGNEKTFDESFDIGGPDVLSYKNMLLQYAEARGMKRYIFTVPVMTPKLSSYWLYFITSISYNLAVALVGSMKVEVICKDRRLQKMLQNQPLSYPQALSKTFEKIEAHQIQSSWKDAFTSGVIDMKISEFIHVPSHGCLTDKRQSAYHIKEESLNRIWSIGGENGWYFGNWLWKARGFIDKLSGGVGLRRGRSHPNEIHPGDAIDFWRVLYANKSEGRLLLFAEMKLPGEAWLELKIEENKVHQTATFRPNGILGRLYWYGIYPIHWIVFEGMIKALSR